LPARLLLPATAATELVRLLGFAEHLVLITGKVSERTLLRCQIGPWQQDLILSDAAFPPHRQVIPAKDSQPTRLIADAKVLTQALARVASLSQSVRVTVNGAVKLSSRSLDGTAETEVVIAPMESTHVGDDLVTAYNGTYLTEALGKGQGVVSLGFTGPLDPLRVDLSGERVAVVMPMRT
jgi:DNA polymerase III sliding clamp (beta) subunit (PCNA family)